MSDSEPHDPLIQTGSAQNWIDILEALKDKVNKANQ